MITLLAFLVVVATALAGGFVFGYIVGAHMFARHVARWLRDTELKTRTSGNVSSLVETPGMQAVIRKFQSEFF